MAYWVFNEEQLDEALRAFALRRCAEAGEVHASTEIVAINHFLTSSREASEHGLRIEEKR